MDVKESARKYMGMRKHKMTVTETVEFCLDQDREERESGDIITLNRETLAEIMADPLAAKLERLAEILHFSLNRSSPYWNVAWADGFTDECDTPLAAVDAALEEVDKP